MKLCVNLVWPSKIICSLILMQSMFKGWQKLCFWWLKTLFWSSGLKTLVFEKHLNSFSCISFTKFLGLSSFYIIFCNFSKKISFPKFRSIKCNFQSIEAVSRLIEITIKIFGLNLPDLIGIRSMLNRSKLKIFSF